MKNPDKVLRELGQLYDFNKEIARFRIRDVVKKAEDKTRTHKDPHRLTRTNTD